MLLVMAGIGVGAARVYVDRMGPGVEGEEANYTLIEPGLYMGGRQGKPGDVKVVLNLSMIKDDYSAEIYEWQPIMDGQPVPTLDWLSKQVEFIDSQRRAHRCLLVHCSAGTSRSGLVVAAYYMWHNHWTREEALGFIRTKRSTVHPNTAFMVLLEDWEKFLVRNAGAATQDRAL